MQTTARLACPCYPCVCLRMANPVDKMSLMILRLLTTQLERKAQSDNAKYALTVIARLSWTELDSELDLLKICAHAVGVLRDRL